MSIRPLPAGQEGKISWGVLGKRQTYTNKAFKSVPDLTTEEKRQELLNKMKPYNSMDYIGRTIFVVGGQGESGPSPLPTPPYTSSLALWWDATDTDTMSLVGTDVDSWTSKGYGTISLNAETTDRRPQYITNGGNGSKQALLFRYNATSALRDNLINKASGFNLNSTGQTIFFIGKQLASPPATQYYNNQNAFNLWNSSYANIYAAEVLLNGTRGYTRYLPQTTGSTTGRGYLYSMNGYKSNALAQVTPYFYNVLTYDGTNLNPNVDSYEATIQGRGFYTTSTTLSAYTDTFINNWDSFGLFGYKYTATLTPSLSYDTELYEVLVYDKVLTESEINNVKSYLDSKWYYEYNDTGYAKITYDFDGFTGTTTSFNQALRLVDPSNNEVLHLNWKETNNVTLLKTGVTYTTQFFVNSTQPNAFNFWLKDGDGNYIWNETNFYTGSTPLNITFSAGNYTFSGSPVYNYTPPDPDASAYLTRLVNTGGTVNATISAATNNLFIDLKNAGLYSKLVAFYPMLGGTRYSTAMNGNNNVSYDIDWYNQINIIFDASGATGNGIGTGGNTKLLPTNFTQGNRHMSFYSNGDRGVTTAGYELGGGNGADNMLAVSYGATTGYFAFGSFKTYSNTDTTGFYYTQLSGASSPYDMVGYKNGTQVVNTTSNDSYNPNIYISVLCDNRATVPSFNRLESSDKRCAWASYGDALTPTEISDLETIVNTFQTALGRNSY